MDLDYLREFRDLVRYGEFTLASEKLFTSQPTLSRHIKALEDELGLPLIVRASQKLELTEYGELVLSYANEVLERTEDLLKTCRDISGEREKTIKIFFSYPPREFYEPFLLEKTEYTIELLKNDPPRTQSEQIDLLARGEVDFLFAMLSEKRSSVFSSQYLRTDRFYALLSKSHPLAGRSEISLRDLRDDSFIMWPRGSFDCDYLERTCVEMGFQPKIILRTGEGSMLAEKVGHGYGVSIAAVSKSGGFHPEQGVIMVPLTDAPPVERRVYYRKGVLSPACSKFLHYLQRSFGNDR